MCFVFAAIVSPPLISHLREVLFILVTQKIAQHVRNKQFCPLQVWGCWLPYLARNIHPEVSGSLFPFKFISHDRVLDRQFFMLQVDLTLDSKFTA